MFKEALKTIFYIAKNLKGKQSFRFMHSWLYLKDYSQWFYGDPARELHNVPNKCKVVDIDLTVDEGQAWQGSGGRLLGEPQRPEGQKKMQKRQG